MNKEIKYKITIGGETVFKNLSEIEAKHKCNLMLALSSRLDIFYKPMDDNREGF